MVGSRDLVGRCHNVGSPISQTDSYCPASIYFLG
jgi:hypothetical protein